MSKKGADIFTDVLRNYKIERVFGNPGTTELPIIDSIDSSGLDFTLGLHEDIAVGMAAGYAMKKQDMDEEIPVSVVNLHTTPGLLHGLCNTYNANFSNAPMIVTTGSQSPTHEDRNPTLSGDRHKTVSNHVKWSRKVESAEQIPSVMRRALRKALTPPYGPVYVDIPMNVQKSEADFDIPDLGDLGSQGISHEVSSLVKTIQNSNNITIFVGDEVGSEGQEAIDSVVDLADRIGADVYGELLLGRSSYDFSHPSWKGGAEHKSNPAEYAKGSDLVIEIGCTTNVPIVGDDFEDYKCTTAVISMDPDSGTQRDSVDILYYGSIASVCKSLIDNIGMNREKTADSSIKRQSDVDIPVPYKSLVQSIDGALDENSNLFDEGVTVGSALRSHMRTNYNFYSLKGGGLGFGLPASVGIQIAEQQFSENPSSTVALIGDGSFHYYPQTIYSAVKEIDSSFTVLVPNNGGYEILKDDHRQDRDYLSFSGSVTASDVASDYGMDCESFEGGDLQTMIEDKIRMNKPNLLEIPADPDT